MRIGITGYANCMLTGAGQVIDVENPDDPQLVGAVTIGLGSAVIVNGQCAYFDTGMRPSVKIVDLTIPSAPITVGSLPLSPGAGVFDLALDGDVLYAECAGEGLASINVTDPTQPFLIQQLPLGTEQARGGGSGFVCLRCGR